MFSLLKNLIVGGIFMLLWKRFNKELRRRSSEKIELPATDGDFNTTDLNVETPTKKNTTSSTTNKK